MGLRVSACAPLHARSFSQEEPVKVSICCIAFNHGAFLKDCLDGFLAQRCEFRVEIIVHDDASTDETADILRAYEERHPSIVTSIIQTSNVYSKGVNPYYAYVFPAASGEYLAICDGDDYWDDPDKLATQVAFLDRNLDISLTYGRVSALRGSELKSNYRNGLERDVSAQELKCGPPINTLTACFRNVFKDGAPAYLRNAPIGDMTVWSVLGHHGRGAFLPKLKPAIYREHDGGIFSKKGLSTRLFMGTITLLTIAAYHQTVGDEQASRACLRRVIGQIVMLNGSVATIREALRKAFSLAAKRLRRNKS